jgi:DNA polymerase-3 subunit delta
MQIKQQMLEQHLKQQLVPIYWIAGQDNYLLDESVKIIKTHLQQHTQLEESKYSVDSIEGWRTILAEANSYSLFADLVLLNVIYDKKTIDAAGKKVLQSYFDSPNSRSIVLIRTPEVPLKQLQWVAQSRCALLVTAYPLDATAVKRWIAEQFKKQLLTFEQGIPDLVYQYTQGNMLASAQAIEKMSLSNPPNSCISRQQAEEHLFNQCDHSIFDLVEACLLGQGTRCIQILRQLAESKAEPTLVLWMLTQEVRTILQLHHLKQQQIDFKTACSQLKIWSTRTSLYQKSVKTLSPELLQTLMLDCQAIDVLIKSSASSQAWNALEMLALSLCLNKNMRQSCIL